MESVTVYDHPQECHVLFCRGVTSFCFIREIGRDLTHSYDKSLTPDKDPKSNLTTEKLHQKLRMNNDCVPT